MGCEKRRADGGAVRFFAAKNSLIKVRVLFSALLLLSSASIACSSRKAPPAPEAVDVLKAVAPADPAKLPPLQESKHWSNPYLVIRPQTVGLLTDVTANEEQLLKPEEVLNALAQLPRSAWPYGRAVAVLVDSKPANSEEDKVALRRNRGIVAGELQSAQIAIDWVPTS
jgi:hypothetical protein